MPPITRYSKYKASAARLKLYRENDITILTPESRVEVQRFDTRYGRVDNHTNQNDSEHWS